MRRYLLLLVAVAVALVAARGAAAALSFPDSCSGDPNPGTCERVDWIANALDSGDIRGGVDLAWWGVWALVGIGLASLCAGLWYRSFGLDDKGV